MIATLPARVVAPRGSDAVGTVWHGSAVLPDGATAQWDWSPAQSLATGAFAAGWTIDGPGTLLNGVALLRPLGGTELADVSGRAAWSLLAAAVPGLPYGCTIPLTVTIDRLAAAGSRGTVRSLAGTCEGRAVARMVATFSGTSGRATPWSDSATTLATIDATGGRVRLHVTAAGATVFGHAGDIEFAL